MNEIFLNLEFATQKVVGIAKDAGAFIRNERADFSKARVEKKHAHDYVSYVDKESEKMIVERLHELCPEAGFLTEEGSTTVSGKAYTWIIDPLDGTTNFIHDVAPYCVSIALKKDDEMILGVVYEICRDECFYAWKDSAAYMNGKEIHVSEVAEADDSFISLGLPYNSDAYHDMATHLVDECYGHVGGIRTVGAAAAELCYVAAGRFDARVEAFLSPWDIAAGVLIVQQAGGKVTDFAGNPCPLSAEQVLASNGKIHPFLLSKVKSI